MGLFDFVSNLTDSLPEGVDEMISGVTENETLQNIQDEATNLTDFGGEK